MLVSLLLNSRRRTGDKGVCLVFLNDYPLRVHRVDFSYRTQSIEQDSKKQNS